jgi:O-antigen ligase
LSASGTFDAAYLPAGTVNPGLVAARKRAARLLDVLVAIWIFSGGIVLFEPSPYELTFLALLPVALIAGVGLYRSTLGLIAIIMVFTPFALIACFQVKFSTIPSALIFSLVTIFLMVTSYFVANYLADAPVRRMKLIMASYTVIAVIAAAIGTLAYLGLMPAADLFLRYGRAKATFKDSNVYGPFLVLPAMFALQRVLLGRGKTVLISGAIYMALFVGVFVSFSRAAWGHFAVSSLVVLALVFLLESTAREKVRIVMMALMGGLMLLIALGGLLSIPAVGSLFESRTESQNYDTGETGRFGRQAYAFDLALQNPWGIGPGEFFNLRITENPHNLYVSVLHVYGWGGGLAFYLLIAVTIWKAFGTIARPSPYRLLAIPVFATLTVVMAESIIIESDHWRHLYLLIGLVWGLSTAIQNAPRGPYRRDDALI